MFKVDLVICLFGYLKKKMNSEFSVYTVVCLMLCPSVSCLLFSLTINH